MSDIKRIFFVRHGSPVRLPGQFIGLMDSPLTEEGKAEAAKTGLWFESQGFSGLVYSSPLSRAYDTAAIIVDEIRKSNSSYDCGISVVDGLSECDFGLFDGKASNEFRKEYPAEFASWYSDPFNNPFPGGESFAQCGRRFASAVEQILDENKTNDNDILIAAHMCAVQAYCVISGLREFGPDFAERPLPCASITEIVYDKEGIARLEKWGWLPD